jgi:tripartite ATP-independent transporter DctM subunit
MNTLGRETEGVAARWVSGASRTLSLVGVVQLLVMMALVVLDVVLRQLFGRPIMGAYELVQFSLLTLVYLVLPETCATSSHIRMTLVVSRLPEGARRGCEVFTLFLSLSFFLLITWRNIGKAVLIGRSGGTSLLLAIPLYPFYALIAFGCALSCLILAGQLWRTVLTLARSASRIGLLAGTLAGPVFVALVLWRGTAGVSLPAFTLGLAAVLLLLLFLAGGLPIAFSMGIVGLIGFCCFGGPRVGLSQLEMVPFGVGSEYILSVVPLFLLMGRFSYTSGLSRDLYGTSYTWLGHLPGGLAMATVAGCAAFAAISGSSVATAVTIGAVALPAMRSYRYSPTLALGSIAAGGTIGILIPPSIVFILYGILTEQSIGKLFMAGLLPGVLSVILYMLTIAVQVKLNPSLGPPGPKTTLPEKVRSLRKTWGMLILFALVLGGIYFGFFTPTEAGAVGACGALILALARKKLTWRSLWTSLTETGRTTSTLVMIFVGAMLFNYFLALTNLCREQHQPLCDTVRDPGRLSAARQHHGSGVDDHPDDPDLFPHHPDPKVRPDLVRGAGGRFGRDRLHHPPGGHQCFRRQRGGPGSVAGHGFPRCSSLLGGGYPEAGPAGTVSPDFPVPALAAEPLNKTGRLFRSPPAQSTLVF